MAKPKFQHRHYEEIAAAIREEQAKQINQQPSTRVCLKNVAQNLSDRLAHDNPNFNPRRFWSACFGEDNPYG